jgi:hypothetical protein
MHLWPCKNIIKADSKYNVKKLMANRPKGLKDEDWNEIVSNAKMDKLIVLNQVPKHLLKREPVKDNYNDKD